MAEELHGIGIRSKIGFFLHIPFPPPDIFVKLPWRLQILRSLLEYDLIGFQTLRDRRNFEHCIRSLIKDLDVISRKGRGITFLLGSHEVQVGVFPISIDFDEFARQAATKEVSERAKRTHENLPNRQLILGVDRLDHTKGIPEKLEAFRKALVRFPDLPGRLTLIQIVVPSRENIPKYQELKAEIERLVGEINGQFTRSGWVPIHYIFRPLERPELLAYYRAAEAALITPLKEGMNLVAKEYCVSRVEEDGVLILSEFAGAAAQLQKHSLIVNPYDVEGVANAIYQAVTMSKDEQRLRMGKLRRSIREQNIFWWANSFLSAAMAKDS